jgi:hypothetical protein
LAVAPADEKTAARENLPNNFLRKAEIHAISLNSRRTEPGRRQCTPAAEGDGNTLGTFGAEPERGKDFFI